MTPRTAESASFPQETFELYARFPKYPTSCSRDDQLAFIADMLDEEPLFPKEVYDLWIKFAREPVSTPWFWPWGWVKIKAQLSTARIHKLTAHITAFDHIGKIVPWRTTQFVVFCVIRKNDERAADGRWKDWASCMLHIIEESELQYCNQYCNLDGTIWSFDIVPHIVLYCWYCTRRYNTIQYYAILYNINYNTLQHSILYGT